MPKKQRKTMSDILAEAARKQLDKGIASVENPCEMPSVGVIDSRPSPEPSDTVLRHDQEAESKIDLERKERIYELHYSVLQEKNEEHTSPIYDTEICHLKVANDTAVSREKEPRQTAIQAPVSASAQLASSEKKPSASPEEIQSPPQDTTLKDDTKRRHLKTTVSLTEQKHKKVPSEKATSSGKASARSVSPKVLLPTKALIVGEQPERLYAWLKKQGGSVYTTANVICEALDIPLRNLRRTLQAWEERGVIEKAGDRHGTRLTLLIGDAEAFGKKAGSKKSKAKNTLVDGLFTQRFPSLVAAGFGQTQFTKAVELAQAAGLETAHMEKHLAYAEYELEHGCMNDAKGSPVASPANWVFKCLSTTGMYRIPMGYVSPLEKQRQALEAEMRAELEARRKLDELEAARLQLELAKQTDELTAEFLASPQKKWVQEILSTLPEFIKRMPPESALFLNALRREIQSRLLKKA